MTQMSLFSSLLRWRLRSCGGAADLGYVGGVDHAYGSGNLFATSVVQSKHDEQALDTIPPGRQLDTLTAERFSAGRKFTSITVRLSVGSRTRPDAGGELRCQTIQLIRSTHIRLRTG